MLAGKKERKLFGISEFEHGIASRLILSTGRFELRKFPELPIEPKPDLLALAGPIRAPERHCFVLFPPLNEQVVWIKVRRLGTMSEIAALAEWLLAHREVNKVAILTSGFHLPRVRLCCRFLLPKNVGAWFLSVPDEKIPLGSRVLEWIKHVAYLAALNTARVKSPKANCR